MFKTTSLDFTGSYHVLGRLGTWYSKMYCSTTQYTHRQYGVGSFHRKIFSIDGHITAINVYSCWDRVKLELCLWGQLLSMKCFSMKWPNTLLPPSFPFPLLSSLFLYLYPLAEPPPSPLPPLSVKFCDSIQFSLCASWYEVSSISLYLYITTRMSKNTSLYQYVKIHPFISM